MSGSSSLTICERSTLSRDEVLARLESIDSGWKQQCEQQQARRIAADATVSQQAEELDRLRATMSQQAAEIARLRKLVQVDARGQQLLRALAAQIEALRQVTATPRQARRRRGSGTSCA